MSDDIFEIMDEMVEEFSNEVPEGAITTGLYMDHFYEKTEGKRNISRTTARRHLETWVRKGILERIDGRNTRGNLTTYYVPKKSAVNFKVDKDAVMGSKIG